MGAHTPRIAALGESKKLCFFKTTLGGVPGAWKDPRHLYARTPPPRALAPIGDKAHLSNG